MPRIEVYPREMHSAERLGQALLEDLGIKAGKIKTGTAYTIKGISVELAGEIAANVLADQLVQEYRHGRARHPASWVLEISYKKGVQDPAELSAAKALRQLGIAGEAGVKISAVTAIEGINAEQAKRIAAYLSNSIIQDCRIGYEKLDEEEETGHENAAHMAETVQITTLKDEDLLKLSNEGLLSLNLEEMKAIQKHFAQLGREPTDVEIETIAQTWSEHCKHKTFNSEIEFDNDGRQETIENLFKETIVAATGKTAKPWLISVFKDNAGIIKFDEAHNIAFKVETHNHPSALDPYGGANTGLGGVIRDVLGAGMGAKPILNTDIFCFASPDFKDELPERILHPKRIMRGVVAGVRDYGNRMGIPTVNGAIVFHKDYLGAPLVFCGTAGIMPSGLPGKKAMPGDLIVAVGGRTGRDGIHGATFSSAILDESSSSSAVQIGNAIEEKKMLDALLIARDKGLYNSITDCGAGGFSSAIGEMAAETGAIVELEKAPLKYEGMRPWEIWVSESQERMIIAVPREKLREFLNVCATEDTEAAVIGEFTTTGQLELFHSGQKVGDLDMEFLHKGIPMSKRKAVWKKPKLSEPLIKEEENYGETLKRLLSHPTIASKEWVIRQYDHEVQAGTVIKPLVGAANDGPGDAAVIKPLFNSHRGVVVANGINPLYSQIDPYWMAASAIDEATRNLVATGGNPEHTALLDNFCWGSVSDEAKLGPLVRAAQACHDISVLFQMPFISGKDSLHNEFSSKGKTISVPDTLLISAISVTEDIRKCITMDLKKMGNRIYAVGMTYDELGGSHYYELHGETGKNVPTVRTTAPDTFKKLHDAISHGLVKSCHDCSEGGIAVALAEMAFSGDLGIKADLGKVQYEGTLRNDKILFSQSNTRFMAEIEREAEEGFLMAMDGIPLAAIGETTAEKRLVVTGLNGKETVNESIYDLKKAWKEGLKP